MSIEFGDESGGPGSKIAPHEKAACRGSGSPCRLLSGARERLFKSCGFLNRKLPTSGSGLMETIFAPRCFARSRLVSIRG